MAAIGSIRKHGVLLMVIIGLALLAFILGDLSNVTRTFSSKNTMAKVDGKKLDQTYSKQYEENTALMKLLQSKNSFDDNETYQIHEMTWQNMLQAQVIDKQLEKLGMAYDNQMVEDFKDNMIASLSTQQPNQFLMQFANALAQMYGPENAMAKISNIDSYAGNDQAKDLYNAFQALVRFALDAEKSQKYFALVQNSINFSDNLAKKFGADNKSVLASIMTVNPDMNSFQNIKAEASEKEIKDFYNDHKKEIFDVKEKNRDINVAIFPINPTAADLKSIEDSVRKDFEKLQNTDLAQYSLERGSGNVLDSVYHKKSEINLEGLDSLIFTTSVGGYIEPYLNDNSVWLFGKVYGMQHRPDSILVATVELPFKTAQNQEAPYSKKEARQIADSLRNTINAGTSIFAIQPNYLYGREQGDSTFWLMDQGTMPDLYNNLISTANGGIYVYKAQGGYVIFQVLNRTQPIEKRQFAIFNHVVSASEETVKSLRSQANQFAASIKNNEELISTAAKQGVQVVNGERVTSMSANIGQLPSCRDIVSWAFGDDVKKDEISDVFNVDRMFFAVASVAKIREQGVQKYNDVKDEIKTMLDRSAKVEKVVEQLNNDLKSGDMQSLAQKYSVSVSDSVTLSFGGDFYMNRGVDGKAIGKVFTLPVNKPTAVAGNNFAYVVNVIGNVDAQTSESLMREKTYLQNAVLGRERNDATLLSYLVGKTKVLDNRGRFYQK